MPNNPDPQPFVHFYPPHHSMDEWKIWLDPDSDTDKTGLCLGIGPTLEVARDQAIEGLTSALHQVSSETSSTLEYVHATDPKTVVQGFESEENECVAVILNGIPEEGGYARKQTFEHIIRMAFQGGLVAVKRSLQK